MMGYCKADVRCVKCADQGDCGQGRFPYAQSWKIFTARWQEGVTLGVLPPVEPLAGVEVDIRMARILNTCLTKLLPG